MSPVAHLRALDRRGPLVTWGALGVVYVVWGSTYLAIRVATDSIPPFLMAGVRFLIAGGILYALSARGSRPPDRRQWLATLVAGGLLFLGGNGGVVFGERYLPSGTAALMVATMPLWINLMSAVALREPLTWRAGAGILLGLGGVALLVQPAPGQHPNLLATAALLASPVLWAAGSLYSRRGPLPQSLGLSTAMQMLGGGVLLMGLSAITGELGHVHSERFTAASLESVAYLVVFGSLLAFSAYNLALRRLPTPVVSTYAYVNPVVAVTLGTMFLGEAITPRLLLSGAVILSAVGLILSAGTPRAARSARVEEPEEKLPAAAGQPPLLGRSL